VKGNSSARVALKYRIKKGITEVLIHWNGLSPADTTWEILDEIQQHFPYCALEDKDNPKRLRVLRMGG
jgi:hypothetical protein